VVLRQTEISQREGLPVPVAGFGVDDQRLLQAIEGLGVLAQGKMSPPEVVQGIADAVLERDLGEDAARLQQVVDGLIRTVQGQERLAEVVQDKAFAVPVASRALRSRSRASSVRPSTT